MTEATETQDSGQPPDNGAEQGTRKKRLSVARLAEAYQAEILRLEAEIKSADAEIKHKLMQQIKRQVRLEVTREHLAETNQD